MSVKNSSMWRNLRLTNSHFKLTQPIPQKESETIKRYAQ